jgi:hypothetical protein
MIQRLLAAEPTSDLGRQASDPEFHAYVVLQKTSADRCPESDGASDPMSASEV